MSDAPDPTEYDRVIVAFSGGKDSLASLLHVIDEGVQFDKIELWHHDVDGRDSEGFMDWPVTSDYVQAVGDAFGMDVYFSWRKGGFEREMLRDDDPTAPVCFETPSGEVREIGGNGSEGTRRKFPQVSGDLSVRWCSAYLKIDVAASAIRNQERFRDSRTLVVTGERAEESASRAKYATFEPHKADLRDGKRYTRHVDHWRPVHDWSEEEVWEIMRFWGIRPHPAYELGWGRLSCMSCIFGRYNQWASVREVAPERFEKIAQYEEEFDCTIARDESVREMADKGQPFDLDEDLIELAMSEEYTADVLASDWEIPQGAFGESCGPI